MRLLSWLKWFFHIGEPVYTHPFFVEDVYWVMTYKPHILNSKTTVKFIGTDDANLS